MFNLSLCSESFWDGVCSVARWRSPGADGRVQSVQNVGGPVFLFLGLSPGFRDPALQTTNWQQAENLGENDLQTTNGTDTGVHSRGELAGDRAISGPGCY